MFAVMLCFVLFACSNSEQKNEEPKKPLPNIQPGFSLEVEELSEGTFLTITKEALGKEFLFQKSLTFQRSYGESLSNPTSSGMKSHIVHFQEEGDSLLMLESSDDYQPGNELNTEILISQFPIHEKREDKLVFDFNRGMKNVALSGEWYASDFGGSYIEPTYAFRVEDAFLAETQMLTKGLSLTQTLTVSEQNLFLPVEMKYYFSQYSPNPKYVPIDSPGFDILGYFEANPLVQDDFGMAYTHITRWDLSKPIVYYISRDVPEEYRSAVKEGVLYWNKVLGKNFLQVELAPEGIQAPDFEHNVIQWHSDLETGAYADAQVDPRTGEILHAQIFVSNSFTTWTRYYVLPRFERTHGKKDDMFNDILGIQEDKEHEILLPEEFLKARLCSMNVSHAFQDLYRYRDFMQKIPVERIMVLTNDYLRWVIAHEVGHTLGLRHNFAASTINEGSDKETVELLKKYSEEGKLPESVELPSNSVMEYPVFGDRVLIGSMIRDQARKPLPYDQFALQWGYLNPEKDPEYAGIAFCTDSQIGEYEDCQRFDAGKHFLARRAEVTLKLFQDIPRSLSERYLAAKAHLNLKLRRPIQEATPNAASLIRPLLFSWFDLLYPLTNDIRLLSLERSFPELIDVDDDEVSMKELEWLNREEEYAGGIATLLALLNPDQYKTIVDGFDRDFQKVISKDSFLKALTPEGKEISFSSDELNHMKQQSRKLFAEIDDFIARDITSILQIGPFKELSDVEEVEPILAQWAEFLLTEGKGLEFRFSFETRSQSVSLLFSPGTFPDWLQASIPNIATKLREKLEAGFKMPLEEIDLKTFPRNEQQKIMDELSLYYALGSSEEETSSSLDEEEQQVSNEAH